MDNMMGLGMSDEQREKAERDELTASPVERGVSCDCGSTEDLETIQYKDGWGASANVYHKEKRIVCKLCRSVAHGSWRYAK